MESFVAHTYKILILKSFVISTLLDMDLRNKFLNRFACLVKIKY